MGTKHLEVDCENFRRGKWVDLAFTNTIRCASKREERLECSRDANEGACHSGEVGEEPDYSYPGTELCPGREKEKEKCNRQ